MVFVGLFMEEPMRCFVALLIAVPLAAQTPAGKWSFGVHASTPDLTGHYRDSGTNQTFFDIKKDFDLKSSKTSLGIHMDYTGSRFGFSLDYGIHDFAGQSRINRQIEINGQTFDAGMDLTSSLKNTTFDVNGTIKILRGNSAWLGVDIGMQAWYLDVQASGVSDENYAENVSEMCTVPIPQIGLSFGLQGLQNRFDLRGSAHFLAYNGAKYTRFTADARYYVLSWLGVRAFMENQSFDAPFGSINDDVEAKLDNSLFGFGVAVRW
jgi:hypothetical protein